MMNQKLVKDMNIWNGNRNTTILTPLKELETLYQEWREQMKIIAIGNLNSIIFYKSRTC